MARQFTRTRGRLGAKRQTSWIEIPPFSQALNNAAAVILVMSADFLAKRPFTVVRTRMLNHIVTDQSVAEEIQIGAFGFCVVSEQAATVGVTAVPTPVSDAGSDLWYVHSPLISNFHFVSGAGFDSDAGHVYTVDSKAMRKVNEDQELLGVVEQEVTPSQGCIISGFGRMLIKEH